jgi:hypothetical protein
MGRALLNTLPDWALILIFVGGASVVALVGIAAVRRWATAWIKPESSETILGINQIVLTVLALILAFVYVNLYSSYENASDNVATAASSLDQLVQDARAFPVPDQVRIDRSIANYIVEVRDREFSALRRGGQDQHAQQLVYDIFDAFQAYSPDTQAQISFYDSAISQLNMLVSDDRNLVDEADSSIPLALTILIFQLAVIGMVMTLFLRTHYLGLDIFLVLSVAVVIGAGLLTALILQFPFSGSISVSSDPFVRGVLGHLVRTYQ